MSERHKVRNNITASNTKLYTSDDVLKRSTAHALRKGSPSLDCPAGHENFSTRWFSGCWGYDHQALQSSSQAFERWR